MARKTHIVLIDDIDGSDAAETVSFGLDGVTYEIDLSPENGEKLREFLSPWIVAGRRVGGRANRRGAKTASGEDTGAIRAWAKDNGFSVSERGRIAQPIRDAYIAAHG